ncbi:MAG: SAM-dependent methyltransferase [Deltaproteobacteria bacterium]|nr:SAM-dependent methyltransferase [Deltaproteobacteria bacterium]MBW2048227.1 SAM-dependent methyltransferase [Deltaproteobacteria bacterium]MBW2111150.1 SAM-dependent methyltransferase [Deltaproteobacteria bacterium]MBW2353371.1 SAM-dependent methyltransferase [Deltaproteobacteria bacterium]HDZ91138.1 SAM-dependent methyltransferase [Deltaproteobacteria bacterium]
MTGWNVGKILKVSGGYWHACTLHAAVKQDLFSRIQDGHDRAETIAEVSGCDPRGIRTLLDALAAMGLVVKTGSRYSNTPEAKDLLVKGSSRYIGFMIMHHHQMVERWSRLDQVVRTGRPEREDGAMDEEERESFLMGMFNMAMGIAPGLAHEIDLSGRRRLLDLGGGPGTYAIHFCLANPGLRATIADLETTGVFAEKTVSRFGLGERIDFTPCDFLKDEIEGSYDVAWLSHILHGEGPDDCLMIVRKAVSALEQGGMVLIHDFILNDTSDGPLFPAIFSLNMLINTCKGRSYTEAQIRNMMDKAGLKNIRRLPFKGPTESGILAGEL